jgi:hypothetical protein
MKKIKILLIAICWLLIVGITISATDLPDPCMGNLMGPFIGPEAYHSCLDAEGVWHNNWCCDDDMVEWPCSKSGTCYLPFITDPVPQ